MNCMNTWGKNQENIYGAIININDLMNLGSHLPIFINTFKF